MKRADISVIMTEDWMLPVVKLLTAGDFKAALSLFLEKTRNCDWNKLVDKMTTEEISAVYQWYRDNGLPTELYRPHRNKIRRAISNAQKGKDLWRYYQRMMKVLGKTT